MSQTTKLSLWQKLKQLLTAATPQAVADTDMSNDDITNGYSGSHDHNDSHNNHNKSDSNSTTENESKHVQTNALSLEKEKPEQHDTLIIDFLKQYFHTKKWHYTYHRPKANDEQQSHHLSFSMRHKQLISAYLFRWQEQNKLLAVYGILPFSIPESHQSAAMLLITQINYNMMIGNLEMDVNDGEIRYKTAIDVEAVDIDKALIEHLLQSVVAMTTVAHELFSDLINNQDPAEDMQTLLAELHQQADARSFFLPTQFVQ
ncbi:YbjN domain-containing protein [Psychrobacter fozii]|uniref:Putative sensory transduction regulator n=1 Tax=Psychrobacter fozii TaxID=198480 RepID=A0A2V4VGS9_9GAMM|nr:YbjN domain-containing protein [Psychrobacter fozii]PYE37975.1 putative sensory transduction regulator [Psychrobacter fozii]